MKRTVTAIIFDPSTKELYLGKNRVTNLYSFIGGGIDLGETPRQAIYREVLEESGLFIDDFKFLKKYITNGIEVHVFFATSTAEPIVELDPDREFSSIERISLDHFLSPDKQDYIRMLRFGEGNVVLKSLRDNTELFIEHSHDSLTVESDSFNSKLSFKEKRALQKEWKQILSQLQKEGLKFKEKRELQKRLTTIKKALNAPVAKQEPIENSAPEQKEVKEASTAGEMTADDVMNEAIRIVNLGKDITLKDIKYFDSKVVVNKAELVVSTLIVFEAKEGNGLAIKLIENMETLSKLFVRLLKDIDTIDVDSAQTVTLEKLFKILFIDNNATGKGNEAKRLKALSNIKKIIKGDIEMRQIVEGMINGIDK